MNTEYILSHTPAQIAAEHTATEIENELIYYTPFDINSAADLFGSTDPMDIAYAMPDVDRSEQLLREWYDECERERPCDAEALEMAFTLYAAWYVIENHEVEE